MSDNVDQPTAHIEHDVSDESDLVVIEELRPQ